MLSLQLFVEGVEVDLFDDESVTLTQSIQDVKDIEKVFTDFSRTFNVPASKNNNKLFKHFYNPYIIGFDARYKKDAELYLNYKLFKKGKIKLEGVTKKENRAHTYRLTFYGSSINLKDVLGEDKLDNLTFLQEHFLFDYNNTNVKNYMSSGLDVTVGDTTYEDAILFPLITHTKRLIYDSNHTADNVNTETSNNIAYINDNNYGLELQQLKPAIRVYPIIKAIENQYPQITFSEDFFSTTNEDFYGLYLWLHNKTGGLFDDDGIEAFGGNFDVNMNERAVKVTFTASSFEAKTVGQDRKLNIKINPPTSDPFSFILYKDGILYKRYDNLTPNIENNTRWGLKTQDGSLLNLGRDTGVFTYSIKSSTAGTYEIEGELKVTVLDLGIIGQNNEFAKWTSEANVGIDEQINITKQLPDIKVLDFITGLFKMFNLTAFQNDNGVIEVKTLDNYYASSTKTWDVTRYIDNTSQTVDSVLPYKQIDFSFEGTDNFFAKNHEELFKIKWGELKHNVSQKFDGQRYSIELPFEHFKFERLYDVNGDAITPVQWGWSADIKQDPNLGKPLLFYPIQKTVSIGIRDFEENVSEKTTVYIPSNSLETSDSFNINFNAENNEYAGVPFSNTLFDKYYKNYITEIFDSQRRLTTTKAFLPMSMLMQFTLADRIKIFDILYRINKITTNFETVQSTLELVNIKETAGETITIDPIVPDRFIPENTCITVDTTSYEADITTITVDSACYYDGITITSTQDAVPPSVFEPNQPDQIKIDQTVEVIAPILQDATQPTSTTTSVYLAHTVAKLGRVSTTKQIDEYGFFYATDSAELTSTDVDTLKANSNVTNIKFTTDQFNQHLLPETVTFRVTGLTSGQSIYWKFYGRTNTDPQYNLADSITETKTSTTL